MIQSPTSSEPIAIESATPLPSVTPTNTKHLTPTATSTTTPTSTAVVEVVCPDPGLPESFGSFQTSGELQESINVFLNQGGELTDLLEILDNIVDFDIFVHGAEADITGDGVSEIIVTIDTLDDREEDHSRIIVFQCLGGKYEAVFVDTGGLFRYLPHPITIVDLNGDSSLEFIIESVIARSARGWALSIYSWQNGEVVDLFTNTGGERLDSGEWELKDVTGDGVQEVILTGYTIFHPDSGFPRGLIETYALQDTGSYSLISTEYLPPEYRHHALEDAQRALDTDDLPLAASFYEQAAYDDNLMNIGSYHLGYLHNNTDSPNEYQRAFALFRLLAIQFLMEDEQGITTTVEELKTTYPEHSAGGEFTTLAQVLKNELESGRSRPEACQEVTGVIVSSFPDLELHIGYWGYLNISYENETICPFN
jgi:hypothetical protein